MRGVFIVPEWTEKSWMKLKDQIHIFSTATLAMVYHSNKKSGTWNLMKHYFVTGDMLGSENGKKSSNVQNGDINAMEIKEARKQELISVWRQL